MLLTRLANPNIVGAGGEQMRSGRRRFLNEMAAGGLGLAGSALGTAERKTLPAVRLGDKQISRLIVGANPIGGWAHSTKRMSELMINYFTLERTISFLQHCEAEGITTFQSGLARNTREALLAVWERGSKLQYIGLGRAQDSLAGFLPLKPIAIVHNGAVTDSLFREGKHEQVHDYVKKVHDAGLLAGVSTHTPQHLALMEDSGWETDLYMTCMYDIYRPIEPVKAKLGEDVIGELYLADDPKRMTAQVRQVKKPCLAFKILAAGRLCDTKASLENAFAFAYGNIKPTDAVIVGMFPIFSDEVKEDCDLARKYGKVA